MDSLIRHTHGLLADTNGRHKFVQLNSDLQSRDFVINRFFMKLFATKNIEIVKYCQEYFGFALPSVLWAKRV